MSTNVSHLADNILPVTLANGLSVDLSLGAEVVVDLMVAANLPTPFTNTDRERDYWFGRYITLEADGGALYYYFSDTAALGLVNAPTNGFWTLRSGAKIIGGQSVDQLLPFQPPLSSQGGSPPPPVPRRRYLHAIQAAGSIGVFLHMWPSSTKAM